MKRLAKVALARSVLALPWGGKEAVFKALAGSRGRWGVLSDVAQDLNITAITVRGDYGAIKGSPGDVILGTYAETGVWARRTNTLLQQFFRGTPNGVFIDVGANIGLTTIPVAQNRNVACIALEPEPLNFRNLTENIAVNCPHGNVKTFQFAAFSERAKLRFELAMGNLGDHRIRYRDAVGELREQEREVIEVQGEALDTLVPNQNAPLAAKIDVQGSEPSVIKGGYRTLSRAAFLIIEFGPYHIARSGGESEVIIQFLENNFPSARLAFKEEEEMTGVLPISAVANRLRDAMRAKRSDPYYYFDVIATK